MRGSGGKPRADLPDGAPSDDRTPFGRTGAMLACDVKDRR